ncbi:MAG: alpha/beta hydrolase [Planctomycetaceae bacterium]
MYPRADSGGVVVALRRLLFHLFVIYAVVLVLIVLLQRKLIYHPSRTGRLYAADARLPKGAVHDVAVTTRDGLTLHGWHFLANGQTAHSAAECDAHLRAAKWVVLYFHGNAGDRKKREFDCQPFTKAGADVLHFDYRGYGDNAGSPSERDFTADARSIWTYAVETRKVPASRIVIFGESLGGGVATRLAGETCAAGTPPGGLILTATFSSLTDAGARHYPWLPVRWLLRDRYPSIEYAPQVTCPVLQIHGRADRIVPIELGRRLHAAFPERSHNGVPRTWVEHSGRHNGVPRDVLTSSVRRFLAPPR